MLRYGPIDLASPTILAPMAGVTDRDFRLLGRRIGGVGLVTMEFISSRAMVDERPSELRLMHFVEEERPVPLTHKIWIPGRGPRSLDGRRRADDRFPPDRQSGPCQLDRPVRR